MSTRKAVVLLAFLALTPGLRQPRERLINLLWSDRGEEQARNSLRQALSAMKKELGDSADLILQVDRNSVNLQPELIEVDALEFESLASEGDYESLVTAADLYQGEFLEGISVRDPASQEWLDSERERFKRQYIDLMKNLAETQLITHDYSHAIKLAEKLVKQDSLHEHGWRILMQAYVGNGERNRALQTFKRCEQVLRDELGVDPESTTFELRNQISAGDGLPQPVTNTAKAEVPKRLPGQTRPEIEHSIAVLPFDNLSGDPEQEYFSDGISESIIYNLSLFPGLVVKSRNSSFAFKRQIRSPGEISSDLEVDYLVEGSIRQSSGQIRINVQLVEGETGNQIWGKRYDSRLENLFELEEELSRTIASTVTGQIASDLQSIAITGKASDQQAYDLLLVGNYHLNLGDRENVAIARQAFEKCLSMDPDNARVHANLFFCHDTDAIDRWQGDAGKSRQLATEYILKAVALDPDSPYVRVAYALHLVFAEQRYQEADRQLNLVLEQNPNDAEALAVLAVSQSCQGHPGQALKLAELALRLDPYHPWARWIKSESLFFSGQYEACIKILSNINNAPGFIRLYRVAALVKLGRMEDARSALSEFMEFCTNNMPLVPRNIEEWRLYYRTSAPFIDPAKNDKVISLLEQAGLSNIAIDSKSEALHSADRISSIAVLPFDNLSGDPEQEYFSDGITESIILNLSLFPDLKVKSRNSSFAFKQQVKSLGEISEELVVDYLVEGSIRKSVNRIRITVQLINASSGDQIWGKRYDAEIEDLLDLEEELSRSIAVTVTGRIESELQRIALTKSAADQQAYDLLMSGIYHLNKADKAGIETAIKQLDRCLSLDPENVRAHAALYLCHIMAWMDRLVEDYESSFELASNHARKALEIDPDNIEALYAYGEFQLFSRNYVQANDYFEKALQINPYHTDTLTVRAMNLSMQGRFEEALELAQEVVNLDPYAWWIGWNYAEAQYLCGQYEEALETIKQLKNAPNFIRIYSTAAHVKLGQIDEARNALKIYLQACRDTMAAMPQTLEEWFRYTCDTAPYEDPSINQDILNCLVKAGLEESLVSPSPGSSPGDEPSVLVLPFNNLSGDPEQEYFSDGFTESVIVSLGNFDGLSVKSRHASFAFRDSTQSIKDISDEIGANYIVEGSMRKRGERIGITVQLAESDSGDQLWGKRYDIAPEELIELEEELVQTVAATISSHINRRIKVNSTQKPVQDLRAYDYLMRGWYHAERFNPDDYKIAIDNMKKCLAIEPDNADAHAILASTIYILLFENWTEDRAAVYEESTYHLNKALDLDGTNALAHSFMAELQVLLGNHRKAVFHADKAIEHNPALPDGYNQKAWALSCLGEHEEACELADISLRSDPYHFYMAWNAGIVYLNAGHFQKAVDTLRLLPYPPPSVIAEIAAALVGLGAIDEAREEMARYLELAKQQMSPFPKSIDDWRDHWFDVDGFKSKQDFENHFDLLLRAGLLGGSEESAQAIPSIAVLPFENLSTDPEQEYFVDGIAADLIETLSKFKHLRTVSRYSTLPYKEFKPPISEIAKQQKVRYILEGNVRRSGNRIRVSAELVDSESESIVWSQRFDRNLDDLFAVQDELTQSISIAMKVHLDDGDMARIRSKGTSNVRSWELTMTAVDLMDTYILKNILDARRMTEEAIKLDPTYPYAWIGLGWTHWQEAYIGGSDSLSISIDEAQKANEKAYELDPDYAEVWSQRGMIKLMRHDADGAIEACLKAVELEPGSTEIQGLVGLAYIFAGQYEKAEQYSRNMLTLSPIRANWHYLNDGMVEIARGNPKKAADFYLQGLYVEPDSPLCRFFLIDMMIQQDDEASAQRYADEIRTLDSSINASGIAHSYSADPKLREAFRERLAKVGLI